VYDVLIGINLLREFGYPRMRADLDADKGFLRSRPR
jgi:excinuclease UvrABC helicase subunit UvrB